MARGREKPIERQQLRVMLGNFPGVDIREMEKQFVAWKEEKGGAGISAENYCAAMNAFIRKKLKRGG